MAVRVPRQLALPVPNTWGGPRAGSGRKRRGPRPNVPHRLRPHHNRAHPAHVTLRAVGGLRLFRSPSVYSAIRDALRRAQRENFRLCHFSVQSNHVHMLIEAESRQALSSGVRGLAIRLARGINRVLARHGRVWGDRYHRHDLSTPREVRHALVYVLQNVKKHQPGFVGLDPCSSACWFDGWRDGRPASPAGVAAPILQPRTWLLAEGWLRAGAIGRGERPGAGRVPGRAGATSVWLRD